MLKRIRELVIPPAWTDVWISPYTRGHLQATGIDAMGRKQYLYHPQWQAMQQERKFERMLDFARQLPSLRRQIKKDLRKKTLNKARVTALALQLMEATLIRPGNARYRQEYNSYGLSTLYQRHVQIQGSRIFFRFRGKKGVQQKVSCSDRQLARQLKQVMELPGQSLFHYTGAKGEVRTLDSGDINAYLKACCKASYTAKDYRTWYASVWAFCILESMGPFDKPEEGKRRIREAVTRVAGKLGNTPAVCRQHYIAGGLLEAYQDKQLFAAFRKRVPASRPMLRLDQAEKRLLKFLDTSV